jgi:hypothetical protein
MALTAATGSISTLKELLRITVADSAAFRTWVGAATQAEALEHIHLNAIPQPYRYEDGKPWTVGDLQDLRPLAIVRMENHRAVHTSSGETGYNYGRSTNLRLTLIDNVDEDASWDDPEVTRGFENTVGTIVDELLVLGGQSGYLPFTELQIPEDSARNPPEDHQAEGEIIGMDIVFVLGRG